MLQNILAKRRAEKKLKSLYDNAVIGKEFCGSPMYSNAKLHVLRNVHVTNKTGNPERLRIGNFCNLSCRITLQVSGNLNIGDFVYMNSNCVLNISNTVLIGSNCLFGPGVTIWDSDNHPLDPKLRLQQTMTIPNVKSLNSFDIGGGDISIGHNVWIGMDCLILGGVNIGEGSVVAARSVVVKDIPPYTLAAGVPAKVVKQLG